MNKQDEARSDVNCWGFWYRQRQAFFDVKVISPFAKSNLRQSPTQMFKTAEQQKIREYGPRIKEVEQADFTPLVLTCTGGMAPRCHLVIKRLAEKMSEKQNLSFSVVSGWTLPCFAPHCSVYEQHAARKSSTTTTSSSVLQLQGWTID